MREYLLIGARQHYNSLYNKLETVNCTVRINLAGNDLVLRVGEETLELPFLEALDIFEALNDQQ